MEDCIFCTIAKNKRAYMIYEDEQFLAFLDIFPVVLGHTLVVPKKHFRWVWDVENIDEYFQVCQKIAKHMQKTLGQELIISLIFGEAVHHAHVHLVPGKTEIVQKMTAMERYKPSEAEFQETVKKLSLNRSHVL